MKYIVILSFLFAIAIQAKSQDSPKAYDPCQKLDTNAIKQLIIGTWVDAKDTNHVMVITSDSVEENILIIEGLNKKVNQSYWNYKFTDNMFSSDAVTCYSLLEYHENFKSHTELAINAIDQHYLLLGGSGKKVFRRKN
jgi:hypothetical protein